MKRLVYLLMAVSLLAALIPAAAFAHTEDDPMVVDLLAGQTEDIGDVRVWNDGDNLYVQYMTTGPWCLTETHVAVGGSAEEIPQTKSENPIPGKFLHTSNYGLVPCVQTPDPYVIPLEWNFGEEVYIAAHAVVVRPIDACYETVWQIGDVEVVNEGTGWLENYADEFNWGDPAGPTTAGPSLAVEQPAYTSPFIVGTTPTSEFPFNSNYALGYATDFDVTWNGGLPFGGKLTISWSPGASAQEKKVVSDGFPATTLVAQGANSPGQGWFLDKYPLVQHAIDVGPLPSGDHTINFRHTQGDGTYWDWVRLEQPCEQWETAWGDGTGFDGKNWAMYFTYTVQQPPLVIAGWDTTRGSNYSLSNTPQAIADLTTKYGVVDFRALGELTAANLADVDVLVISSVKGNSAAITPILSGAEQSALYNFVLGGGCAILFPDNSTFAGGNSDPANESLIDPFGLDITGTLSDGYTATISAPWTLKTSYVGNYAGWFNETNGATVLGHVTVSGVAQPSLVQFAPGYLGTGSGRVVVYSDANVFFGGSAGRYTSNTPLFLDTVDACFQP